MKRNILVAWFLLYIGLLQAEGFVAGTAVQIAQGDVPVEQLQSGDCIRRL